MNSPLTSVKPEKKLSIAFFLFIIIALGVILRIIFIGSREFWFDEVLSLLLSTGQKQSYRNPGDLPFLIKTYQPLLTLPSENSWKDSIQTVIAMLRGLSAEPHPPLFFLSQHFWLRWWGNGETAMRSLPAIISIGGIFGGYGLGKVVLGRRGGLILAALMAVNPFFLFHSLNVRMYGYLIVWTTLAAWSFLALVYHSPTSRWRFWGFNLLFIASITAGCLTFYTFLYWLVSLVILVFYLDRRRWWQHGLRMGIGVLGFVPWAMWGLRQQLRNGDFARFNTSLSWGETLRQHLFDVTQTLGIQVLMGDTVTSLPTFLSLLAGIVSIALLGIATVRLWRQKIYQPLIIALMLGVFPLLLTLAFDLVSGKFTVGFGWGRSISYCLPGLLLLLAVWLEKATGKRQNFVVISILLLYLLISIADFTLRPRQVFGQVSAIVQQYPSESTLIVMNTRADGHVLRLAYYLPQNTSVALLAQNPSDLAPTLEKVLNDPKYAYSRLILLDSARPVWGAPQTEAERQQFQADVQKVLDNRFQLQQNQSTRGTWTLDDFTISVYE